MSRFIESIKLKDGQFYLLAYHAQRVARTLKAFYPNIQINLLEQLKGLPEQYPKGWFKVRVVYQDTIENITITSYLPKPICQLQVVESDLGYSFKYENRNALKALKKSCQQQEEEIIIIKDNLVTDASYANLAFFDGKHWWTPKKPLLAGVQRQFLLDTHKIQQADITISEIKQFQKVKLFNALLDWEDALEVNIDSVRF